MKLILAMMLVATVTLAQTVPAEPLIDVVSNESKALSDFKGARAIVVIFTSNVCAYDKYYAGRFQALLQSSNPSVQFLFVNSGQEAEERPEKMKSSWQPGTYLADKDQVWMKSFGARKTPEVFVLDSNLKVVYSGAIDDNPQVATAVKENYLKKVLDDLVAGKAPSIENTRAAGCSIRTK